MYQVVLSITTGIMVVFVFLCAMTGVLSCAHLIKHWENDIQPHKYSVRTLNVSPNIIKTIEPESLVFVKQPYLYVQSGDKQQCFTTDFSTVDQEYAVPDKTNRDKWQYNEWTLEKEGQRYVLYDGKEVVDQWIWRFTPDIVAIHDYHIAVYVQKEIKLFPLDQGILGKPLQVHTQVADVLNGIAFVNHHLCVWSETQIQYVY